jgi:DtxR family manganese transport transcriptional regulator
LGKPDPASDVDPAASVGSEAPGQDGLDRQRFDKARTARSAAILEDYTELIADLLAGQGEARTTEIARALGVAHPTANKAIARLKREGLATSRPYRGIFLTEAGRRMAERVRTRHRTVVKLLIAIGVPPDAAETDAEGIEHHVSDVTLEAALRFLAARDAD